MIGSRWSTISSPIAWGLDLWFPQVNVELHLPHYRSLHTVCSSHTYLYLVQHLCFLNCCSWLKSLWSTKHSDHELPEKAALSLLLKIHPSCDVRLAKEIIMVGNVSPPPPHWPHPLPHWPPPH